MRLHPSAIQKLLQIYSIYGGHREETKLKEQLLNLDLTPVKVDGSPQTDALVLTESLIKR